MGNTQTHDNMRHFFDDIGFGGSHRPQTARPWIGRPRYHYQTQQQRPRQQQNQTFRSRDQRHNENIHEAADKLMQYGFDRKAVYQVLQETGTHDLHQALRILAARGARQRASTSRSPSTEPVSPRAASSDSDLDSDESGESEEEEEDEERECMDEDTGMESEADVNRAQETEEQGPQSSEAAMVADSRAKAEAILVEAHQLDAPDLRQTWRQCKMLNGVPVDIVGYEESLLRLQMKLDNITAGDDAGEEERQAIRAVRREAVRKIQGQLDQIDAVRGWWLQQNSQEPAVAAGTAVAVA